MQDSFSYDAYGVMLGGERTTQTSLLYTGEQYDSESGNYYLRARYYDPLNGRFNRVDPFAGSPQDPQSLHKYLYVHANPVNGIDPTGKMGLIGWSITIGITIVVIALIANSGIGLRIRAGLSGLLGGNDLSGPQRDIVLAAGARLNIFKTTMATHYWRNAFLGEDPLCIDYGFEYSNSAAFLAQVKPSNQKIIVFGRNFFNEEWTVEQRSLIILHELRHSIKRCTEEVAFEAQWIAEVRYRAAYNKEHGGKVLIPPEEPTNVVWGEKLWTHEEVTPYISLEKRREIVEEFNKNGRIDGNWPGSIY